MRFATNSPGDGLTGLFPASLLDLTLSLHSGSMLLVFWLTGFAYNLFNFYFFFRMHDWCRNFPLFRLLHSLLRRIIILRGSKRVVSADLRGLTVALKN